MTTMVMVMMLSVALSETFVINFSSFRQTMLPNVRHKTSLHLILLGFLLPHFFFKLRYCALFEWSVTHPLSMHVKADKIWFRKSVTLFPSNNARGSAFCENGFFPWYYQAGFVLHFHNLWNVFFLVRLAAFGPLGGHHRALVLHNRRHS